MAEGMDIDATRYQRTAVHGTVSCGPLLEISDREESPRGATERDLDDIDDFTRSSPIQARKMENGSWIERCLRDRSFLDLPILLINRG